MAPQRSLKARALECLAQREHSRAELRRKLLAHVSDAIRAPAPAAPAQDVSAQEASAADGSVRGVAAQGHASHDGEIPTVDPRAEVEATLDWLEANRYLSQERFVESRVQARAARFGNLRIRQELKQHAVALSPEAAQALNASELDRARAVWSRRFQGAPASAAERARQYRFLAGRGFSPDVIRRLVRCAGALIDDDDGADGELPSGDTEH